MLNKVAVVGMPQSGSTAIFNIVLRLLEHFGNSVYTSVMSPNFSRGADAICNISASKKPEDIKNFSSDKNEILLIKEHHYIEEVFNQCDKIICVRRNMKEAIASRLSRGKKLTSKGQIMTGTKWPSNSDEQFKMYCNYLINDCYEKWQSPKSINIDYESYCENPVSTVNKISYGMFGKIPEDAQEILKKAVTYRDDEDWYTLFTESKINTKKIDLSQEMINYIDKNFSNQFLKQAKPLTLKPIRLKTGYKPIKWNPRTLEGIVNEGMAAYISKGLLPAGTLECRLYFEFIYSEKNIMIDKVSFDHFRHSEEDYFDAISTANEIAEIFYLYLESVDLNNIVEIYELPMKNNQQLESFMISSAYDWGGRMT